jgi:hypothetical protein
MVEVHMQKIIENIPTMSDEQLLNVFNNAIRKLAKNAAADAEAVVAAVEREWELRMERVQVGLLAERPTKGMLHELGYKVGEYGEAAPIRRMILKHVLERELPLVSSPAYTKEWGAPNSPQRYRKLVRFLEGQLSNPAYHNMARAMIEWSEDLEWVQRNYASLGDLVRVG